MKKLFISVLAIAGLVACSQEQTLVQQGPAPIELSANGVNTATRVDPSLTTDNLTGFDVWAWMDDEQGNVLTGEDVTKYSDGWGYTNVAYWAPGHNYTFAAVAPMNSANWTYNLNEVDNGEDNTIAFTNIDGTEDLIYASATKSTVGDDLGKDYEAVALAFDHLLAKTKFTFKNGFATENNTIQITDVKVKSYNKATYSIAAGQWSEVEGEQITLAYGDTEVIEAGQKCVVADERLIIPASAEMTYEVTYTVTAWQGGNMSIDHKEKTTVIKNLALEQGKSYNFVATISPDNIVEGGLDAIEFEIIVNEWDEKDLNIGQIEDEVIFVTTIDELQATLDAAKGDTTVVLGADLQGNVTVPELAGATIAIVGNDYTFDGTFALVGGSTYGEGTTVFDGINFKTSGLNGYDAFIYCNDQNGHNRYPDSVTIKNCTFTAEGAAVDAAVCAKFRSLKGNLVVENCEAVDVHSLVQLTSCGEANVVVDGANVNAKNGISLGYAGRTVIRKSQIVAREYGVRADGCVATTSIEETTIEAKQPVVVRKVTVSGYVLKVDEASQFTTSEPYQVIFTAGQDDAAYVAPTVNFVFNGPSSFVVFPYVQNAAAVTTDAEFAEAINNGAEAIVLADGEFYVPSAAKGKTLAIYGSEATTIKVASVQSEGLDYNFEGATAVLNNVTISTVNGNYKGYARPASLTFNECTFTNTYSLYGAEQIFNNCTFNVSGDKYNVWTWGASAATFNGCTFNCDGKSMLLYGQANTVLTINDCTFNDNGTISGKAAIEIGNDYNKSYQLFVNRTEVNGFDINPNGINTNTTLWANKNSMSQEKLNVVVDNVDVY